MSGYTVFTTGYQTGCRYPERCHECRGCTHAAACFGSRFCDCPASVTPPTAASMSLTDQLARLVPFLNDAALDHGLDHAIVRLATRRMLAGFDEYGDEIFHISDEQLAANIAEEHADVVVYHAEQLARRADALKAKQDAKRAQLEAERG